MRKRLIVSAIIILAIIFSAIGYNILVSKNSNKTLGHAKVDYFAENLEDLTNKSGLIVEVNSTNSQKEFQYNGVVFVKTQVKIKNVIKGDNLLGNKEITILQTKVDEDPIVDKGGRQLLFLDKYDGPIIDNAYVCKGLYQGHYKVKNDKVIPSKDLNKNLSDEIGQQSKFNDLIGKIKSTKK